MPSALLPGTEVLARSLRWEVVTVESLGPQTMYRLRGLEGSVAGRELDLLHPFERIEPVIHELRPERAAPLRNWLVYHQAFLLDQALGPDALLAVQPGRLRLEPYQLVPVLRAIRMSRVRLLLADGVGLGKTVEAGLVLTELMARRLAHRILIVSPAGPLLDQWRVEMVERFGLRLDVIDRARMEEIRRSTELGSNPFDHVPLGLASIDFLKQERVLDQLERASYDVIVVDEAHHCMDLGSAQDREGSQRRRLAEVLARGCDAFLLVTATPHDGNDRSFASLCELLDPSLVDGRGALRGERYRGHVVRRLKRHVPGFRERQVLPGPVRPRPTDHRAFIAFQQALLALVAPELRRAFRSRRYSDVLAYLALLKRSVSTVAAAKSTLAVVSERFQELVTDRAESQDSRRQRLHTLRDYHRKLERFGTTGSDEEHERQLLEVEDLAQQLAALERELRSGSRDLAKVSSIVEGLDQLVALADSALGRDPKLEQLESEIEAIRRAEPGANVLVYTEYTDSQSAAVKALKQAGLTDIVTMSGEDDDKARGRVTALFRSRDGLVLVSTDAAAEGLNLHQRCHHLIHLELPFNPNRLEQRNGRIDRYGQQQDPIVRYLFLRGTFEDRILLRLIAKYERQRARLTFVPNTLGLTASSDATAERLLRGLMDEDTRLFKEEAPIVAFHEAQEDEGTDEATRELLEEVDRSLKSFEQAARTHAWLGDVGVNAEASVLSDVEKARALGQTVSTVDLAGFVTDAVEMDGGRLTGNVGDEVFTLQLPAHWHHGMEDLPGWDPATQTVRLTTRYEVTQDSAQRSVGLLGRAHPLIRRALDRVRNLTFGGASQSGQDPRVSVVKADVGAPTLLLTYLGRVGSRAGRELERVLAVRMDAGSPPEFLDSPESWIALADPRKALRTTDVWRDRFEAEFRDAAREAREIAERAFLAIAEGFVQRHRGTLEGERSRHREWIQQRVTEITTDRVGVPVQPGLFDRPRRTTESPRPNWASSADPVERLAGFAGDRAQPPALRSEADGAVRIYRQRMEGLDARLTLSPPEIVPLGLLMLLPEAGA